MSVMIKTIMCTGEILDDNKDEIQFPCRRGVPLRNPNSVQLV